MKLSNRVIVAVLLATALAVVGVTWVVAQDGNTIYACVNCSEQHPS